MNNLSHEHFGGTFCLSKAGLAEGTNSATIKTAAPNGAGIDYCIDGILYHKAEGDNIAMTALEQQADLTSCLYLVQINAAGTISLKKGTERLNAEIANDQYALEWPRPDAGNCPIGGIKVVMDGGTFTSGTTDLSGTGVTDTFYDFFAPPPQGLAS
ncbi:hypothetical protein [Marinobacterium litorale]|uniref:hypothetical protein n=1 Tax=Marinobacterium litorale TaxID=404770 RepID=UPI00041030D9|nr:hypothetical protein [Marinobacterium litorale]